ncbi:hypothetical protein EUX98_g3076 [Antrodiella citrinella]|uniref:PWWP domain-containing protein n=1 Tax=Antrodiella citrinella TaxID=2447956 RepID=A0A4S4N5S3_9APHY|nr:hypothetical protein EUX98_g3076 [Antrodiella citrinella]
MDSLSPLTSPEDTHRGARGQDETPSPGMDDWSLDDLGHLVWVRVNQSGRISDDRLKSMWWPAQVTQASPLQMTLFGRSPLARGDGFDDAKAEVTIDSPSAANVRSMTTTADIMRFNEHNYGGPSSTARSTLFSPKKKQKIAHHDILSRWEDARRLMLKEDQRDQDGLPRFLSFYTPGESEPEDDLAMDLHPEAEPDEIPFVPPPPNFEYDIPGELVLSKDKSKSTQFWPAKILEYVPPKNAKQKPRYKVLFFDHSIRDVTEDMFLSESQEGFGTCKLGESEGNYGLDEEEQDVDEDVDLIPADDDEEALRADTPIPEMPPPKYFETLSIDEQFEYVKPVLSAILQERYEPIRARHDAYMRSAAYRQQVVDQNHDSGQLKGYELEQLGPLIRQWRRTKRYEFVAIALLNQLIMLQPLFYPPPPPSTIGSEPDLGSGIDIFSDDGAVTDPLSEPVPPSSFESAADREERSGPVYSQAGVIEATAGADDDDSRIPQNGRGPTQSDKPPQAPSEARAHTKSFASLTEIDQLTYCSSILLQEAKYQLLLWRHGLRQSFELLSPTEEKRLHEEAEGKATETDWVHTIILSRRVAENSLLPKDRVEPKPLTRLRSGRD